MYDLQQWAMAAKDRLRSVLGRLSRPVLAAAGGCALCAAASAAPAVDKLTLGGPGAVVSYPLMHMVETGALKPYAAKVEFRLWETHDQLSSLLAHKKLDFTATPTTLPALLANRGQKTRLLSVSVWGLVWLVSTDPAVKGFGDLAGQELLSPFQHDLGDVLIDTLLTAQDPDGKAPVRVRRTRSGQDAIALMLSGQGKHVVLAEPAASLLLWRGASQGKGAPLHRVQSLEEAWPQYFPHQPSLPQAGLMANATVADDLELSRAVEKAYAASAAWCKSHAPDCAQVAHKYLPHMPVDALRQAIEVTRLESRPATEVRTELEALYTLLKTRHPKAIGNKLPEAGFYGP
ncbi:ABC transporter substrate-binding protein [Diaphorobacter ruginosibacter]|uniref:ABC transporter substrate-binding protein n=1 Tax=Diaphorobacter ruginosibacter TaxID=1715720 RepID=UPI0033403FB1